jgi:hypothetical protein
MSARPELGDLTVGQDVVVVRSPNDSRRRKPEENFIPARVVKVARVWIEIQRADGATWPIWRMRRDTQDEGSDFSGNNAQFVTLEQHAWEEARRWGQGVLQENGITIGLTSPWRGREAELADLIVKGGADA